MLNSKCFSQTDLFFFYTHHQKTQVNKSKNGVSSHQIYWCLVGNFRKWSTITIIFIIPFPYVPIHSLRLAPVDKPYEIPALHRQKKLGRNSCALRALLALAEATHGADHLLGLRWMRISRRWWWIINQSSTNQKNSSSLLINHHL